MKKQVFIVAVLALFSFSCSTEDSTDIIDNNVSLEKETSLSKSVNILYESKEFKSYLNEKFVQKNAQRNVQSKSSNNEHGIMILESNYNLGFGGFDPATGTFVVIGGLGKIEKMPNGKAKFSVHTNNPEAGYFGPDFNFSSDCIDGKRGVLNFNFVSEYIVNVFEPIPGLVFTSYIPTGENSSAESGNGHCKISDAQPLFDENFEFIGCSDMTEIKTMKVTGNRNANGEGKGFSITVE